MSTYIKRAKAYNKRIVKRSMDDQFTLLVKITRDDVNYMANMLNGVDKKLRTHKSADLGTQQTLFSLLTGLCKQAEVKDFKIQDII